MQPSSPHFHSTVSVQKLRRFNLLAVLFRCLTFCFSLASFIFMLTNSHSWYHFDALRYVFAASGIVSLYSLFQMFASVWEVSRGLTLLPQVIQVWFDFSHDQVFAYILMSANSAGLVQAMSLKGLDKCAARNAFCLQLDIAIALGFIGFLFFGFSTLLSGFRVACFLINGSRFHI